MSEINICTPCIDENDHLIFFIEECGLNMQQIDEITKQIKYL